MYSNALQPIEKMKNLSCFKTYDIRGEINVNIDESIVYRISRATSQHFSAKSVVVGFDARKTSPTTPLPRQKQYDPGSDVINIGLAGTEEMYWAVSEFKACAGIIITASHNPINYNGMKIVKSGSQPLCIENDLKVIKRLAEKERFKLKKMRGKFIDSSVKARSAYSERVLSFIDLNTLKPLKIVVNSENGAAGPTFDAIAIDCQLRTLHLISFVSIILLILHFQTVFQTPLLPKNHLATAKIVKEEKPILALHLMAILIAAFSLTKMEGL